ncbi:hypothetical protein ACF2G4_20245 (plasmid) [Pantoea sp. C3]|uniref:hypothetical protein n=1 Tax=Pantoea phytostimulans TaxID=2769024 RepID=UPI0038F741A3
MTLKADAITVRGIMDQFVKDETVKKKLRFICEKERNDWEKWLQLELEYFMCNLDGIEVDREIEAFPDNRMLKDRYKMYIDLAFRKKRTRQNSFIFLELKCTNSVPYLIRGFERDITKINALKACIYEQRSFWCVGFHRNCTERSVSQINDYVKKWDYGYHEVIKLCDCSDDVDCGCEDNKLGFAVI